MRASTVVGGRDGMHVRVIIRTGQILQPDRAQRDRNVRPQPAGGDLVRRLVSIRTFIVEASGNEPPGSPPEPSATIQRRDGCRQVRALGGDLAQRRILETAQRRELRVSAAYADRSRPYGREPEAEDKSEPVDDPVGFEQRCAGELPERA